MFTIDKMRRKIIIAVKKLKIKGQKKLFCHFLFFIHSLGWLVMIPAKDVFAHIIFMEKENKKKIQITCFVSYRNYV
jgi:hypothetical protein